MQKGWPHNVACVLCLSEPETVLHLLATCSVTKRIWERVLSSAQHAPRHDMVKAARVARFHSACSAPAKRKGLAALVQLTWWIVLKEGNARIFQNIAASLSRIHACVVDEAKLWREAGRSSDADLMHRPREPY
jgi:hypothetical protein